MSKSFYGSSQKFASNIISFMMDVPIIETSPLICRANQWTGFYMKETSVMKEFSKFMRIN